MVINTAHVLITRHTTSVKKNENSFVERQKTLQLSGLDAKFFVHPTGSKEQ